jgi:hypothetical protein
VLLPGIGRNWLSFFWVIVPNDFDKINVKIEGGTGGKRGFAVCREALTQNARCFETCVHTMC